MQGKAATADEKSKVETDKLVMQAKLAELFALRDRTNADLARPGRFAVKSQIAGIILTPEFRETLLERTVKPNEPLMRIGAVDAGEPRLSDWEIRLKIPQKHIGQVLRAFKTNKPDEALDVDLLVSSLPTQKFKGKLRRDKISLQAQHQRDAHDEPEPVVLAWVRVHGDDIPEEYQIPRRVLQVSDVEIRTRIRCGDRAMGYSLFYGVWEWFYETVVFWF